MSDTQWLEWGKKDPYYGVYSENRFRTANIEHTKDEFFQTGEKNVRWMLDRAENHFGLINKGSALEFGSGVARMSIPLGRLFLSVTGVELSPDMRAEAKRNCASQGIANVEFVPSDDALSAVPGKYDLVLSYIVLQHIHPERGIQIIDQLLSRTNKDGVAILQVSVGRPDRRSIDKLRYHVRHNMPLLTAAYRAIRGRGWSTLSMRMSEYNVLDILPLFSKHGMKNVLMSEHYQDDVLTYHFTARKGAFEAA